MRTKTLAAAAILAAGLASSMAQSNVYSLNVVGYVNKPIQPNQLYTAVANPLNTTSNTLAGLFLGLANGSQIQKWNNAITDFNVYSRTPAGFGNGGNTVSANPGEGFFVKLPSTATIPYTNTFVGEVLQGSLVNPLLPGFNMVGSMVPQTGTAAELALTALPLGTQIQKWDEPGFTQDFKLHSLTPAGYGNGAFVLEVAEGFFVKNTGTTTTNWIRNFTVQ